MDITVRKATKNDSKKIFEWRNDPVSMAMSLTSKIIDWKGHKEWYNLAIKDKNILIAICQSKSVSFEDVGMVRFDFNSINKDATISINLNPKARGNSLGQYCLKAAINYLQKSHHSLNRIMADIKSENIASIRTFEKAGFNFLEMTSKNSLRYVYELEHE
ncbi:GNAT family N-acetyltransferase [Gammaproteobacteria bacterium]|nr:GNAT family N-acetyltransferase [Gammaproteobacteria bacterium]MDA8798893.1 GNAT family N-acetyltransferase [Gammaproteobacteria bacterium]MDC0919412.1 GNAT family N-acetyltransferase [Gammaproteobacteria bacterium]